MKKISTIIIALIMVFVIILLYWFNQSQSTPTYYHQTIAMELDQSDQGVLSLNKISVMDLYPQDNKRSPMKNYFQINLLDESKVILFSTRIESVSVLMSMIAPDTEPPLPQVTLNKELLILLPYYKRAHSVEVLDEKGNLKLRIDLAKYNIKPIKSTNLCGNGICDRGENFLFCRKDCNP